MSRQHYIEVIRKLTASIGLSDQDANKISEGGALEIGGVLFSLVYGDTVNPYLMFVYCDFGEVPQGKEAKVYEALLENNLSMYNGTGPVFGLSPYTRHVLLALPYPLDKLEADKLLASLTEIVDWAKQWRTHHFLETPNARVASGTAKMKTATGSIRTNP